MKYILKKPIKGIIGDILELPDGSPENKVIAQLLIDNGYIEEDKGKWEPHVGEDYYCIDIHGKIKTLFYQKTMGDDWISDYAGIYKTEEEAESARDAIKAFVMRGFK